MIHAETRPLFGSAINDFLEVPLVIRMGSIDNHLHVWTYRAFAFEDAKDLIGLVEFPARNVLVARFSQIEGYKCFSLTRALDVVKCQLALV